METNPKATQSPNVYGTNAPETERPKGNDVEEGMHERRKEQKSGGMGREGTPKDEDVPQGKWENDEDLPDSHATDAEPS